jgi:predicted phage gp36 major capsid-like protein
MSFTGSNLSADAVRAYLRSKKEEAEAEQRARQAGAKAELDKLHEAFLEREVQPEAMDRIATLVRRTVDMGDKQALVVRFPSDWLPDQGRAITNHDRNWPEKLDGFAKRAYDYFKRELEPRGFQIRAEILDWPGGMPGDVGFFLQWKRPEEIG